MSNAQLTGRRSHQTGAMFEKMIDAACRYYQEQGYAAIAKTPEPMKVLKNLNNGRLECCFEKQAEPDYKGVLDGGITVLFDAKTTDHDRIQSKCITDTQMETLDMYQKMGAVCFVFVSLGLQNFYRVPWSTWKEMKSKFGHLYMNEKDLEPYRVKSRMGYPLFLDGLQYFIPERGQNG